MVTAAWILLLLCGIFLGYDLYAAGGTAGSDPFSLLYTAMLVLVIFEAEWLFAVMAAFSNSLRNLLVHAAYFAAGHIVYTILLAASLFGLFKVLTANIFNLLFYGSLMLIFGFGLIAWLASFYIIRCFAPYLPEAD